MSVKWYGNDLRRKIKAVTAFAINETITNTIAHALNNHSGWKYRTGVAEGSISQKEFATPKSLKAVWGSIWTDPERFMYAETHSDSNYVYWLEFKHGSFLRLAADAVYPSLRKNIKKKMLSEKKKGKGSKK